MLKKLKFFDVFIIFLLSFLFHYIYDWFPNKIFAVFFPINESIWEHMKLIVSPFYIVGLIDYIFLIKKEKINNFFLQLFIVPLIGIISYLIIYLPIYNYIGENMFISIFLLFIIICFEEFISFKLLLFKNIKYQGIIGFIGIIIIYIIFGYLTYNPPLNYIFYDSIANKYGLNTYKK